MANHGAARQVKMHVYLLFVIILYSLVSGDANFVMARTALTVGGFTQPASAKKLIEQPADTGFAQRFLWMVAEPTYSDFEKLEAPNEEFCQYMSKNILMAMLLSMFNTQHLSKIPLYNFGLGTI